MPNPTPRNKPAKPFPEFALFPHSVGLWAKQIRGKFVYFGPWADWEGALRRYQEQAEDLHAGRKPREAGSDAPTVRDLLNRFLTSKKRLLESGEITSRTFDDYHTTCEGIGKAFGLSRRLDHLGPDDFEQYRAELAKKRGPVALGNEIQRIRVVFKYCFDAGLTDRPIRYGPGFRRPSKKMLRKARAKRGVRMFEAHEIRALAEGALVVGDAGPVLVQGSATIRAMVLLGANCGFGDSDVGRLPLSALDLDGGWVNYRRPRTFIERRAPFWPETVQALREAIARRPTPKNPADADLCFVTKYGTSWANSTRDTPVAKEIAKLLKAMGIDRQAGTFTGCGDRSKRLAGNQRTRWRSMRLWGMCGTTWPPSTGNAYLTSGCVPSRITSAPGCSRPLKRSTSRKPDYQRRD
jgi:hypothetical protein